MSRSQEELVAEYKQVAADLANAERQNSASAKKLLQTGKKRGAFLAVISTLPALQECAGAFEAHYKCLEPVRKGQVIQVPLIPHPALGDMEGACAMVNQNAQACLQYQLNKLNTMCHNEYTAVYDAVEKGASLETIRPFKAALERCAATPAFIFSPRT